MHIQAGILCTVFSNYQENIYKDQHVDKENKKLLDVASIVFSLRIVVIYATAFITLP